MDRLADGPFCDGVEGDWEEVGGAFPFFCWPPLLSAISTSSPEVVLRDEPAPSSAAIAAEAPEEHVKKAMSFLSGDVFFAAAGAAFEEGAAAVAGALEAELCLAADVVG